MAPLRHSGALLLSLLIVACAKHPAAPPPPPEAEPAAPHEAATTPHKAPTAVLTPQITQLQPAPPPQDGPGYNNIGVQAYSNDKVDEAITNFTQCITIEKTYIPCYRNLGVAYERKGDTKQAIKYYKTFLKLSAKNKEADEVRRLLKHVEGGRRRK